MSKHNPSNPFCGYGKPSDYFQVDMCSCPSPEEQRDDAARTAQRLQGTIDCDAVVIRDLRAELAASESLVTALQEQMARHAEQHAKAVAEHEAQLEAATGFTQKSVLKELERFGLVAGADFDAMKARAIAAESALAAEVERHQATAKALREVLPWARAWHRLGEATAGPMRSMDVAISKAEDTLASLPAGPREDR